MYNFNCNTEWMDELVQDMTVEFSMNFFITVTFTPLDPLHNIFIFHSLLQLRAQWKWDEAASNVKVLSDTWKLSPATFAYLYGCCRAMQLDELLTSGLTEDSPKVIELRGEVDDYIKRVPQLKRNFGGKKAFHEKLVYEHAMTYIAKGQLIMPILDVMYIWNIFKVASYKSNCLQTIIDKIEYKLQEQKENIEIEDQCRLIFMKGVAYSNLNLTVDALNCFYHVTDCEKLSSSNYLLPQACFEIALVFRKSGDLDQAKRWLNKCVNDYSGYLTESMINYRASLLLKSIKHSKNSSEE